MIFDAYVRVNVQRSYQEEVAKLQKPPEPDLRSSGSATLGAGRSDPAFARAVASERRLSRLICFSSAQITQSMNVRAGATGMRSNVKAESTMTNPPLPHPIGATRGGRARLGTEVILPPWETAPRKDGAVNL